MVLPKDEQDRVASLYRDLGGFIYGRCLKLLKDPERARDATQDVFVKLMKDNRLEARADDPLPWVYNVATCHCIDVLRAMARQDRKEALLMTWETDEGAAAQYASERQLAVQVLSRFDAKTQAIAVGILVDGMEQTEVADALGLTRQTVARKLDRFLVNARKFALRSTE